MDQMRGLEAWLESCLIHSPHCGGGCFWGLCPGWAGLGVHPLLGLLPGLPSHSLLPCLSHCFCTSSRAAADGEARVASGHRLGGGRAHSHAAA